MIYVEPVGRRRMEARDMPPVGAHVVVYRLDRSTITAGRVEGHGPLTWWVEGGWTFRHGQPWAVWCGRKWTGA